MFYFHFDSTNLFFLILFFFYSTNLIDTCREEVRKFLLETRMSKFSPRQPQFPNLKKFKVINTSPSHILAC